MSGLPIPLGRVREPSGLEDNQTNRRTLRKRPDLVLTEIENGIFDLANGFPRTNKKDYYSLLNIKTVKQNGYRQPLSSKSIRNYRIPLHIMVRDAMDEFGGDNRQRELSNRFQKP